MNNPPLRSRSEELRFYSIVGLNRNMQPVTDMVVVPDPAQASIIDRLLNRDGVVGVYVKKATDADFRANLRDAKRREGNQQKKRK